MARAIQTHTKSKELPCGCIRGSFLCRTAVHLWMLVNDAYSYAKLTGDWARYDKALEDYYAHYNEKPPS